MSRQSGWRRTATDIVARKFPKLGVVALIVTNESILGPKFTATIYRGDVLMWTQSANTIAASKHAIENYIRTVA